MQFIYLVRPREFADKNVNIYKIGRTEDFLYNRLNGYSKSTEIILAIPVNDSVGAETELKKLFANLYIKRKDIGDEYFEGNVQLMVCSVIETLYPNKLYQDISFNKESTQEYTDYQNIIKTCEFKGYCEKCTKHDSCNNIYNYCTFSCDVCSIFRKAKTKNLVLEWTQYYHDNIEIKPKQIQEEKIRKNTKVVNIQNNITINNITQNYICTKDSFYHVTISSNEDDAIEHLRYMFTYLMCGASGKELFPNENKHSKAVTFPVSAAKYNIVTNNTKNPKYTLYGILRYEYQYTHSMTIKKLEKLGNQNYLVCVYTPNIGTHKTQILKNDIDYYLNTVKCSDNGSNIEQFYINNI